MVDFSNPPGVEAPTGQYTHVALVKAGSDLLFISGQVGVNASGATGKTIDEQVEFAFANGPIATSGTTYTRQECKIFQFDEDQPLTGGIGAQVTAKPCKSANAPTVVTVP